MFQRRLFLSPHVASWLLSKRGKLTQLVSVGVLLGICSGVYGTLSGPFFEATISPGASADGVAYRALSVLSPSGVPNALLIPVLIVCTAICKAIGAYLFRVGRYEIAYGLGALLRRKIAHGVVRVETEDLERRGGADLVNRFLTDVEKVESWCADGLFKGGQALFEVLCLFCLCLYLNIALTILLFAVYPLVMLPLFHLTRRLRKASREGQDHLGSAAVALSERVHLSRTIRFFDYPSELKASVENAIQTVYRSTMRAARLKAFSSPLSEVLGALALAGTLVLGMVLPNMFALNASSISVLGCVLLMYRPIKQLGELPQIWAPAQASFERLDFLLNVTEVRTDLVNVDPRHSPKLVEGAEVEISRNGQSLFKPTSFTVRKGDRLVIAGVNGVGKSSLVETILGFRLPSKGRMSYFGVDANCCYLPSWRKHIGWLSQDTQLFGGTLLENVRLGRTQFNLKEVQECWQSLGFSLGGLDDPDWGAKLKPGGAGMSGGELRKVLLTRACLGDPKLLVLDEPEAFQDAESQKSLSLFVDRVPSDTTIIVVSHQASTWRELGFRVLLLEPNDVT